MNIDTGYRSNSNVKTYTFRLVCKEFKDKEKREKEKKKKADGVAHFFVT